MSPAGELGDGRSATVRDIVRLLVPPYPELPPGERAAVEREVTGYVASQVASMPGFLRRPYAIALVGFEWLSVLRYGRRFRALSPVQQSAYLVWWSDAPLAPMRDVVKLIRSTALLAYFDHPAVVERLEAERRQARPPVDAPNAAHG